VRAKRHTPNQVIRKLREAERMLGEGKTIAEVAKALEVSEVTFHCWRNQYGGMKAEDAKRLKELEKENVLLKRLVADKGARDPRPSGDLAGKLLSPARRRKAVLMLQDRVKVSERRACEVAGQHRSTQRHEPKVVPEEEALRRRLRRLSASKPRWGYRRAHGHLLSEGWQVNRKRVQRIWREEGLRVPARKRKAPPARRLERRGPRSPARNPPGPSLAARLQHDATADGRGLKFLNVVDEFTREALAIEVDRTIDADETVAVLERLAGRARGSREPPGRQRPRADRPRAARVVRGRIHRHLLHRSRSALAERLGGVAERPLPRRGPRRRGVRHLGRGPLPCRRLAARLHPRAPPLRAWHDVAEATNGSVNPELSQAVDR